MSTRPCWRKPTRSGSDGMATIEGTFSRHEKNKWCAANAHCTKPMDTKCDKTLFLLIITSLHMCCYFLLVTMISSSWSEPSHVFPSPRHTAHAIHMCNMHVYLKIDTHRSYIYIDTYILYWMISVYINTSKYVYLYTIIVAHDFTNICSCSVGF